MVHMTIFNGEENTDRNIEKKFKALNGSQFRSLSKLTIDTSFITLAGSSMHVSLHSNLSYIHSINHMMFALIQPSLQIQFFLINVTTYKFMKYSKLQIQNLQLNNCAACIVTCFNMLRSKKKLKRRDRNKKQTQNQ